MITQWVSFKDRLPRESEVPSGRVLVHVIDGWKSNEYDNWGVHSPALHNNPNVDYWMAIPELPNQ